MTSERHTGTTSSVASSRATLRDSLEQGFTLPAEWYTDAAFFQAERARIFQHTWQFVGFMEHLATRGSFFTTRVGDTPLVLTHDQQGALHAFVNICRHRASELVLAESGCRQTLQCPYHAWTYNLDGSLRAAPGAKDEPDFHLEDFALVALPVATWGPLIFVNLDRGAEPLEAMLGELPRLTDASGARLGALHRRVRRTHDIAANWKVIVDNYLECYHCPVAHKGFSELMDVTQYTVTEYEWFSVQGTARNTSSADADTTRDPYATQGDVQAGFYAYLWPNFTLNVYPGHGNVSINHFIPLTADRTLVVKDYCFLDEVPTEEEEDFIRFIEQVQGEDTALCESVQRGLSTGYYDQGRLLLSRESALRHFQKLVYRALEG